VKTPIVLGGTLRRPAIRLKPGNSVGQVAVATVLGAVATPFAAIAAFVDPGLNQNVNCSRLLQGAQQHGAPLRTAAKDPSAEDGRSAPAQPYPGNGANAQPRESPR